MTVDGLNAVVALDDEDMRRLMNGHGSAEGGSSEKASSESSSLPSFAVYNISVKNSSLQVLDRARAIDQSVTDFNLELPFVSTLANSKSSLVTPKLSMKLNGTPIFATGSTQPFGTTLSARLNMKISNLDLAPVFKLVPALNTPSLMLENGRLSTEVNVVFRNATSGKPGKMLVSGTVNVNDLTAVQQVSNRVQPLASFKKASLQLTELDLLEHQASVGSIVIQDPKVHFVNTPSGLNVSQTAQGFSSGAAADSGKDSGSNSGWHWRVDSVQIRNGNATWNDSTVRPAAKINVTALNATVTGLTNAANAKPAKAEAGAKVFGGMLSLAADVTPAPLVVNATLKASGLQAAQLASYIRNATGFDASGAVSLNVKAAVKGSAVTGSGTASLTNLQVKQGKSTLVSARTASVKLGSLDTAKQSVNVDSILLDTAVVNAVMTSAGLNLMPSKAGAAKKAAQKDADAKTTEKAGKPWQWKVASADVKNSRFNFRDTSVKPNAAITVSDINASVKNLSSAEGAAATVKMSAGTAGGTPCGRRHRDALAHDRRRLDDAVGHQHEVALLRHDGLRRHRRAERHAREQGQVRPCVRKGQAGCELGGRHQHGEVQHAQRQGPQPHDMEQRRPHGPCSQDDRPGHALRQEGRNRPARHQGDEGHTRAFWPRQPVDGQGQVRQEDREVPRRQHRPQRRAL